ncbi:MAG: ASCH domain-containing protein [Elusimicrobia bacterium]|nr:ASCH domain-containing protein [Elusimicrobiota bacterium]
MKAISLKQPWAVWVVRGRWVIKNGKALERKDIETRTWSTKYRGPLLICASKSIDYAAMEFYDHSDSCAVSEQFKIETGVAVGIADLVNCRPMTPEDEQRAMCACEAGRFAWDLKDIRAINPFPVRGALGLFEVAMTEDAR